MGSMVTRRLEVIDSTEARTAYGLIRVTAGLSRYRILVSLREREKNVSQLMACLGLKQSTVSHNLRHLISEGLVVRRAEGAFRFFSINKKYGAPVLDIMDGHAAARGQGRRAVLERSMSKLRTSLKEAKEKIRTLELALQARDRR